MAKGFKHGGSLVNVDANLNYEVVRYDTEDELDEAVQNANVIGVVTSIEIPKHYFSATKPENMVEGEVWFGLSFYSPVAFNALKGNSIMVYPLRAKQMVNGELLDVTAKNWQNDEWVDWVIYYYKPGDECADITGGWTESFYKNSGTITKTADGVKLSYSHTGGSGVCHSTENEVDLTNIDTIKAVLDGFSTTKNGSFGLGVNKTRMTDYDSFTNGVAFASAQSGDSCEVDVSSLTGNYYIYFGIKAGYQQGVTSTVSGTLKEIKTA